MQRKVIIRPPPRKPPLTDDEREYTLALLEFELTYATNPARRDLLRGAQDALRMVAKRRKQQGMTRPTRWRRTQIAQPDAPHLCADDWTLTDTETGECLARIYDTQEPDILGAWRWHVAPYYRTENQGSALTGAEARAAAEKRLAEIAAEDDE